MGQASSRCGCGKQLISCVQHGDASQCSSILASNPEAACYASCFERNSPLLVASARGHARMVQAILEAAVLSQGLTRAKKRCINHSNNKGQSALMLACINGHAQCVEVLVCNGASPLVLDNARHNSALHWAASACRADCVGRLLGSGAMFQMQSGQLVAIADIPCFDEDNSTLVKFIDRHNGWGLTALHLATHKGSSSTVRALLRHGASVTAHSVAPSLSISPDLQPPGSTALHFAAAAEDVSLVLVLLEAQVSRNEPDLRRVTNADGDRPIDLAHSSSNPLLQQLLDPSHPLSLHPGPRSGLVLNPGSSLSRVITREGLRQHQALLGLSSGAGFRASRRGGLGPEQLPHIALGGLLQRLKLVLSLEAFALQQQLAAATGSSGGSIHDDSAAAATAALASSLLTKQHAAKQQQLLAAAAADDTRADVIGTAPAPAEAAGSVSGPAAAAVEAAGSDGVAGTQGVTATSGISSSISTPPEISPSSSSGGDDTRPLPDSQQQQHKQSAAQLAALQLRLRMLQQHMATVDELLAQLPASATSAGSSGASSPPGGSNPPTTQQQQQQQQHAERRVGGAHSSNSSSAGALGRGSWGLLGGLLSRSSTEHSGLGGAPTPGSDHHHQQQQQQQRLFGRRSTGRHGDSSGSDNSSPASAARAVPVFVPKDILVSFITFSVLSSLGAVTKLFVGASSLSAPQQQQQQQQQQQGLVGSGNAARWAEQEHALVLLKGILKTVRSSLEAAQQAAAAAASRSALRQRHQQQLANLLGGDNRPVHSHTLRRALLGERLVDQGRIRFGGSAAGSSSSAGGGGAGSSSLAAAYLGGSMAGMSWGLDSPLGLSAGAGAVLPAAAAAGGGSGRHASRRHRHRDRSRGLRGDEASGGDAGLQEGAPSRRHHRHHSRHHRSGRRRTPRAVDLPLHDLGRSSAPHQPTAAAGLEFDTTTSSSNSRHGARAEAAPTHPASSRSDGLLPPVGAGHATTPLDAGFAGSSLTPEQQQQQQYLRQLAGILSQQHASSGSSSSPATADAGGEVQPGPTAAADRAAAALNPSGGSSSGSGSSSGDGGGDRVDSEALVGSPLTHRDAIKPLDDITLDSSGDDSDADGDGGVVAGPSSLCSSLAATTCAICMDCTAGVSVSRCSHSLCLQCAYQLCYKAEGLPLCPFCRQPIDRFDAAAAQPVTAPPAAGGIGS